MTVKEATFSDFQAKYPKLRRALGLTAASFSNIAIITRTALKAPDPHEISTKGLGPEWERRSKMEREEEALRREAMSVGRNQPHRTAYRLTEDDRDRGYDDTALATPLGRFCLPKGLRIECYTAGERYAETVRQARVARGDRVPGLVRGEAESNLTPEQREAMNEAAIMRETQANSILRAIHPRLPRVMERFCYDQLEISPYDEGIVAHGLVKLALEAFGLLDDGINRGKA